MEADKILVIEGSDIIKKYLKERLERFGFEIIFARDAFDGLVKMKNNIPDLVIIDYFLTQNIKTNFLEEKRQYKTIADIPMIMLGKKFDKDLILSSTKYKIAKFFTKPIKIDLLLKSISEIIRKDMDFDQTPCMIDAHLNDDILFIEVASGLNKDKIESLKYKISEIKNLYKIDFPKILLILVDLNLPESDFPKLVLLLDYIMTYGNNHVTAIKILTSNVEVSFILRDHPKYKSINVTNDINVAIDELSDIKIDDLINKSLKRTATEDEIIWTNNEASFDIPEDYSTKKFVISVVDDDILILEFIKTVLSETGNHILTYKNGKELVDDFEKNPPDLIFLDLMMPKMNGFEVLEFAKKGSWEIPIIIFSALTQKETVKKAMIYGVKSYIAKPVNPETIIKKAKEILKSDF